MFENGTLVEIILGAYVLLYTVVALLILLVTKNLFQGHC